MRRVPWPALLIVLGAIGIGAALSSCASSRRGGSSKAAAATPAAYESLDSRKDDIRYLWMQIRDWRVDAGMSTDPRPDTLRPSSPNGASMQSRVAELRLCERDPDPQTEICTDACNIKDAICDNAESICRIAADLGGDPWADEKCRSAKASCKEARDRCCSCVEQEGPVPGSGGAASGPSRGSWW